MLLDSYLLTKEFEDLILLTSPPGTTAPLSYIKRVNQTMSRIFPLLKTLQVRPSPPESLVQAYLIHIADKSDVNFRKILELKGIRKQDQANLMELFIAHKSSPRHDSLPAQSPLLTTLMAHSSSSISGPAGVAISSLSTSVTAANLHGRFDPATLGSALMTAARDGVDRLGTPSLGGSNSGSRTVSPPPAGSALAAAGSDGVGAAGNVNQNLRNIGKFFKRDLGGFGGRFGGAKSGEDGGR